MSSRLLSTASRLLVAVVIAGLILPVSSPSAASAITGTVTSISVGTTTPAIGTPVMVSISVVPNPGAGSVQLHENGVPVDAPLALDAAGQASTSRTYATPGPVSLTAVFSGWEDYDPSTSAAARLSPKYSTSTAVVTNNSTATRIEETVTFTATVSGATPATGEVTFYSGSTPLGTRVLSGGTASYSISTLAVGTHAIKARYKGSASHLPSVSNTRTQVIEADTRVRAASVAVQYGTFYPVVDRYIDSNVISGTLGEVATVAIRIYNSSGTLVRWWDLPNRAVGPYALAWNGKNQSGSLLAAGTYRVRTIIVDRSGNRIDVSKPVSLSRAKVTVSVCGGVMDAAGNDHDNENGEYVVLCNTGVIPAPLGSWSLRDTAGHTYVFPTFTLAAGARATLYTGSGTNSSTRLYWGSGAAIWNNDGDCATLYNWVGTQVHRRCF